MKFNFKILTLLLLLISTSLFSQTFYSKKAKKRKPGSILEITNSKYLIIRFRNQFQIGGGRVEISSDGRCCYYFDNKTTTSDGSYFPFRNADSWDYYLFQRGWRRSERSTKTHIETNGTGTIWEWKLYYVK